MNGKDTNDCRRYIQVLRADDHQDRKSLRYMKDSIHELELKVRVQALKLMAYKTVLPRCYLDWPSTRFSE